LPSDDPQDEPPRALDVGLLSPVTVGTGDELTDAAVLDALVSAEVALVHAYGAQGLAPAEAVQTVEAAFGWLGPQVGCRGHGLDAADIAEAAVSGGNPVIPLVGLLKERVPAEVRVWVHRGATSQDILDSALMRVAAAAAAEIADGLSRIDTALVGLAGDQLFEVGAARTLTQHGVPTTVGLRFANWLRGVRRAADRLDAARAALPAQLGGAGGTLASFVELFGEDAAAAVPAAYADALGLAAPDAPWHTSRWPVTELGDALVQAIDALGKIATDVATLTRTEIAELSEGSGGGSSAMPQKQNPVASVLIRSAALRAPQLGATLHLAAALAADERPDGAWHAEWPTLRELLRLARGAASHAEGLVAGLRVDREAVARNLALTRGLIVSERLALTLAPVIGKDAVGRIVAAAGQGGDLRALVREAVAAAGAQIDVDALLDPANYIGLAQSLVRDVVRDRIPKPSESDQ
jgi:3-carboxy-cis,cis-muconate cycloisomerase